jgi:riboflavin-specific deaminase-like protein
MEDSNEENEIRLLKVQGDAFEIIRREVFWKQVDIHVTLTYAQSLDGVIGTPGRRLMLSGEESSIFTHCLRQSHDAILVGIGTVEQDQPRLSTRGMRGVESKDAKVVVVDVNGRCTGNEGFWDRGILVVREDQEKERDDKESIDKRDERIDNIIQKGGQICKLRTENGRFLMRDVIEALRTMGVQSVMVEGGAGILSCFIREGCYDVGVVTTAPIFVGEGTRVVGGESAREGKVFLFGKDQIEVWRGTKD